jgi:hypothetical protein
MSLNKKNDWNSFLNEKVEKKIYIFDFDGTLALDDTKVQVKKTGEELGPKEYERYRELNPEIRAEDFDFSAFEGMISGNTYEKTAKILTDVLENGQNVVILTARSNPEPVKQYLSTNIGANVPVIAVNSPDYALLGDSDATKKANWIKKQILSGVDTVYFYEDSDNNIAEVQKLRYDDEISDKNVKIFIYKVIGTPGNAKIVQKEVEEYQKDVKRKHMRNKSALIKVGGQKTSAGGGPYSKKAEYKRSKSAPAGAGGT